jgi:CheY-like chemotaxis protein
MSTEVVMKWEAANAADARRLPEDRTRRLATHESAGRTVFVVEDEPLVRDLVSSMLRSEGYAVRSFDSLTPAAVACACEPPDLLVLDVELPDGDGLDLIAALDALGRSVPTIVMSGRDSEEEIVGAFSAGAADYLVKPFREADLLARCRIHLGMIERRPPTPSGVVVGRYTILRELARGGCGIVYLARDSSRGDEPIALKMPLADQNDSRVRARFIREAGVLATIRHPNVVSIHDIGMVGDRLFCAMEFVPGESLYARVRRAGAIDEASVRSIARALLSALGSLERTDVLHRDIKPSNVILRRQALSDPVLIDFGLARWRSDPGVTRHDMFMGTIGYTAPEVLALREPDIRSDLFSLGLTLRFALAGEEVFPNLEGKDLYLSLANEPVPALDLPLSAGFASLLSSLCAKDPDQRPPSAAVALARLDGLDEPPAAPRLVDQRSPPA